MNLIEFAVERKIETGDPLLEYVAKGQDVPVAVLSESLKDLLAPLEDARSSHLVSDYIGMLQAYIPTTHVVDPITGEVSVSGEIPADVMESIMLVHNVEQEAVVSDMVTATVSALSQQPAEVRRLDLQMLEQAINTMKESMPVVADIGEIELEDVSFEPETSIPEDYGVTFETQSEVEDLLSGVSEITIPDVVQPDAIQELEVSQESVYEPEYQDVVPIEEYEEPVEVQETPEDAFDISAVAKRIYNKVVEDLEARGLVEALNLDVGMAL